MGIDINIDGARGGGWRCGGASGEPEPPVGDARERAEDAYDTAFIAFEDEYAAFISLHDDGYGVNGSVTTTRNAVPIRGIQRERLSPTEFYDAVGRTDLAADYQSARRKKLVVGGVSLGAFTAGLVMFGIGMSKVGDGYDVDLNCSQFGPTLDNPSWDAYDECRAEESRLMDQADAKATKWFIGGGVAIVGGLVFGAIYRHLDPHPVSESERRLLAYDHNERLRRELRLPRKREVSLSPFISAEGGGLMAVGRF